LDPFIVSDTTTFTKIGSSKKIDSSHIPKNTFVAPLQSYKLPKKGVKSKEGTTPKTTPKSTSKKNNKTNSKTLLKKKKSAKAIMPKKDQSETN
jgi:hypothetical protein